MPIIEKKYIPVAQSCGLEIKITTESLTLRATIHGDGGPKFIQEVWDGESFDPSHEHFMIGEAHEFLSKVEFWERVATHHGWITSEELCDASSNGYDVDVFVKNGVILELMIKGVHGDISSEDEVGSILPTDALEFLGVSDVDYGSHIIGDDVSVDIDGYKCSLEVK